MRLNDKKILVTGADGFIGSHLVELLIDLGYDVKAFVLYNSFNSWGWLDSFPKEKLDRLSVFAGDIRDSQNVRESVKDVQVIFHLAALIAIPFSYQSPSSYVQTNIHGTLNILEASKDYGIEKILVTSTSEVYGTAQYIPIDENHPRQGQSPYSATKIGSDSLAESFYRSFNLPVTVVRPFNTYGPRQSARAAIPTIIAQLINGKSEVKLGSLKPTRDLVFVKDTVKGFLKVAECDDLIGQQVNIATQREISIGDLATLLIRLVNPEAYIVTDPERLRPENSEVYRLIGSNRKLWETTGWKPEMCLEDGLNETVKWFSDPDNLKYYKPDIYNV